jgi:hypothetical protein
MRVFLGIVAILLIAGSFYADYRWRRWMADRRAERQDR